MITLTLPLSVTFPLSSDVLLLLDRWRDSLDGRWRDVLGKVFPRSLEDGRLRMRLLLLLVERMRLLLILGWRLLRGNGVGLSRLKQVGWVDGGRRRRKDDRSVGKRVESSWGGEVGDLLETSGKAEEEEVF